MHGSPPLCTCTAAITRRHRIVRRNASHLKSISAGRIAIIARVEAITTRRFGVFGGQHMPNKHRKSTELSQEGHDLDDNRFDGAANICFLR